MYNVYWTLYNYVERTLKKMTTSGIPIQFTKLSIEQPKKIFKNHGAPKSTCGIIIVDLKNLQNKIKKSLLSD